jgi:hypothetical protein
MPRAPRRPRTLLILMVMTVTGAALSADTALARNEDGSWEVGAYIMNSGFDNDTNIDDAFGGGIRGAYHFKAAHALEVDFDVAEGEDSFNPDRTIDITKYGVSYMHNFFVRGHEKTIPHSIIGLGRIDLDDGTNTDTSTFYRFGGGFKHWFSDHSGIRFDLRIYRWRGDGTIAVSSGFFSLDITVGVSFLFGGAQ